MWCVLRQRLGSSRSDCHQDKGQEKRGSGSWQEGSVAATWYTTNQDDDWNAVHLSQRSGQVCAHQVSVEDTSTNAYQSHHVAKRCGPVMHARPYCNIGETNKEQAGTRVSPRLRVFARKSCCCECAHCFSANHSAVAASCGGGGIEWGICRNS